MYIAQFFQQQCCSKSPLLLLTFNANYSTFSEESGSKPLLRVLNYSDAEPESIEQDCRGQETETHLARNWTRPSRAGWSPVDILSIVISRLPRNFEDKDLCRGLCPL